MLYWGLPIREPLKRRVQNIIVLFSSLFFYGFVEPWLIGLLLFSTLLDYCVGLGMSHYPQKKGWYLSLSFLGNLSVLFVFKYFDWFSSCFGATAQLLGFTVHPYTLGLLLPIGISFYTFQTLSYTIDVYRGVCSPQKYIIDYATFVCYVSTACRWTNRTFCAPYASNRTKESVVYFSISFRIIAVTLGICTKTGYCRYDIIVC